MNYSLIILIDKNIVQGNELTSNILERIKNFDVINYEDDFENPNRKYNSYIVSKIIPTINSGNVALCRIKEVDLAADDMIYEDACNLWDHVVEYKDTDYVGDDWQYLRREYLLERYKTKDCFASAQSTFHTFAILTKDGQWLEESQFNNTYEWLKTFIKTLSRCSPDDWVMSLNCTL